MPNGYNHLDTYKRCQIFTLKAMGGVSQREIARQIGCAQSTISRELKRNKSSKGYDGKVADSKAQQRRARASQRPRKITAKIKNIIEPWIRKKYSPDEISGRMKMSYDISVSHETIYKYIWEDKKRGGDLYKNLRRCGKKYNKRGSKKAGRGLIPNRRDISERPQIVAEKSRVGDWEGDTIVGAGHTSALVSLVDRVSKITKLRRVPRNNAYFVSMAICNALWFIRWLCHSITSDNGKEFSGHEAIAKVLGIDFFFATPYRSCERGLNENTNGLVRQYFPKGTDFSKITDEEVLRVEEELNNRPRKSLNYRTPNEEFKRLTGVWPA